MNFQPTPAHIEWLGIFVVLTAALHFAERVWSFINKIINDCQRRKQIEVKRRAQQAARLAAKLVPMPSASIGTGESQAKNSVSQKGDGKRNSQRTTIPTASTRNKFCEKRNIDAA
jgi:hypothetical protein